MEHPNSLLQHPKAVWLCNLIEQAAYITNTDTEEMFEPCVPGIYVQGSIKPLIKADTICYVGTISEATRIMSLEDVLKASADILDDDGNTLIKRFDIVHRKHLYTTNPALPVSAMHIAYNIIMDYLFKQCKYARGVKRNQLDQFIKPEYDELFDRDHFEDLLTDTLDTLHDFIRCDPWSIYFHKLHGTTLIIEKHVDWRIHEYTRMMYEKNQKETGEVW